VQNDPPAGERTIGDPEGTLAPPPPAEPAEPAAPAESPVSVEPLASGQVAEPLVSGQAAEPLASGEAAGPDEDPDEDEDFEDEAPPARAGHGTRDMAISLAVLLVPLAIVFAISRLLGGGDVVVVDPAPALSRAAAAFPVVTPHGLPDAWRPVSATFDGHAVRIGYVTPAGGAVQLIESNEAADPLLVRELGDNTRPTGPVTAGGASWRSFDVRNDEHALVRTDSGRTVIVIGKAGPTELATLAGSLA